VEASDVDRTLMSAEANLAGLYPPQDPVSVWNPSILWQPIPVHTQPSEYDNVRITIDEEFNQIQNEMFLNTFTDGCV
jgi:hypothetical protein